MSNTLNKIKNQIIEGSTAKPLLVDVNFPEKLEMAPLVIFCHGFKGFKDWGPFNQLAESCSNKGFTFIKFNFSHNGGTAEQPIDFPDLAAFAQNTYSKELEDLETVISWVHRNAMFDKTDRKKIYLLGHSRGGGIVLLKAAKDKRIAKVATWAAVSDFYARLPEPYILKQWKESGVHYITNGRTKQEMPLNYSFVQDLLNNEYKLNIKSAVKELKIPQLIVHGATDETVKLTEAEELKVANPSADLIIIENAGHTFGGGHPHHNDKLPDAMHEALEKTVQFFNQ